MHSVTSGAVALEFEKYIFQLKEIGMNTLGWTPGNTYTFQEFIAKIVAYYGSGWRAIKFLWANAVAGYLKFSDNSTLYTSGAEIFGFFQPNNTWTKMHFLWLDNSHLYLIHANRTDGNTMTVSKIQIV